jgi:hypothetical protein
MVCLSFAIFHPLNTMLHPSGFIKGSTESA